MTRTGGPMAQGQSAFSVVTGFEACAWAISLLVHALPAIIAAASCAAAPAPPVAAPAPAMEVAAELHDLQVAPLEVVFCSVRGEKPAEETVALRNEGGSPPEV